MSSGGSIATATVVATAIAVFLSHFASIGEISPEKASIIADKFSKKFPTHSDEGDDLIICALQEALIDTHQENPFNGNLLGLKRDFTEHETKPILGEAKMHPVTFALTMAINGPTSLANKNFLKNCSVISEETFQISDHGEKERAILFQIILYKGELIKVVNLHLIGGGPDDISSLEGEKYLKKLEEVKAIVAKFSPDIIIGDFNQVIIHDSKEAKAAHDGYFGVILNGYQKKFNLESVSEEERVRLYDNFTLWMRHDETGAFLESCGYICASSVNPERKSSSSYVFDKNEGPDYIYVRSSMFNVESFEVRNFGLYEKGPKLGSRITDHAVLRAFVSFVNSPEKKIELYSSNVELWNLFYNIKFTPEQQAKAGLVHFKTPESFEMSIKKALCYLHNIGQLSQEEYHFLIEELGPDVEQSNDLKRRRTPEKPKDV